MKTKYRKSPWTNVYTPEYQERRREWAKTWPEVKRQLDAVQAAAAKGRR